MHGDNQSTGPCGYSYDMLGGTRDQISFSTGTQVGGSGITPPNGRPRRAAAHSGAFPLLQARHLMTLGSALVTLHAFRQAGEPLARVLVTFGRVLFLSRVAHLYLVWLAVVVALYPLCRRYAELKGRSRAWWLSYL